MAQWVSHLIVADRVLESLPWLKRHAFCVGSIAPDCNIPNDDWTDFTPSRQVTHWMVGKRKNASDCVRFRDAYIMERAERIASEEELSFLLGYYAHLITDAEMQRTVREETRVAAAWARAKNIPGVLEKSKGMEETWDNFKRIFPHRENQNKDFCVIEREYLDTHPESGYFTEIKDLASFPDYLDYLPKGAIPKKVRLMYDMPASEAGAFPFVAFSREEYNGFLDRAVMLSTNAIEATKRNLDLRRGQAPIQPRK